MPNYYDDLVGDLQPLSFPRARSGLLPSDQPNLPSMEYYTSLARSVPTEDYANLAKNVPQHSQYQPSGWRRFGSMFQGLGYGPNAQRAYIDEPYNRALQDWITKAQAMQMPSTMALSQARISELGQRALSDAARARLYERQASPEYERSRFGYKPQSYQEAIDLEKAKRAQTQLKPFVAGEDVFLPETREFLKIPDVKPPTPKSPVSAGNAILMPDGKGGWAIMKNPYPRPFAGRASLAEKMELEKFKAGLKTKNVTPQQIKVARNQAIANIISKPQYAELQKKLGASAGQLLTSPEEPKLLGLISGTDPKLYKKFQNDVTKETDRILGTSLKTGEEFQVGSFKLTKETTDEDEEDIEDEEE